MRTRDHVISLVCMVLAALLLWLAGAQLDALNVHRKEMKLVINEPLENAPPSLAFATVAMGAFRGLVVDILWMRADRLKQEGQFFDAKQLAEWITVLQPRFGQVWEFQAWNMAYNISVAIPATQPDQRWMWVRNGYELLRDKGIPLNPKNLKLYRELGRIFQHKIGGFMDECHKYYKLQLAQAMDPLAGGGSTAEQFEELAQAPTTWEAINDDPNVQSFLGALQATDPVFKDPEDCVANYLMLMIQPSRFVPEANEVLMDYWGEDGLVAFDRFARAYELRHTWKLDPARMVAINKKYGPVDFNDPNHVLPLDWRNADTHAIYWAEMGLSLGGGEIEEDGALSSDEMNNDRIILHSLQNLFRAGQYHFFNVLVPVPEDAPEGSQPRMMTDLMQRPDYRMFDRYNVAALTDIDTKYSTGRGRDESLSNGHRNFVKNAVSSFYYAGHKQYALHIFRQMQKRYPDRPELQVSLEVFIRERFKEEFEGLGISDAREMVTGLLREAYASLAFGELDQAAGNERLVQQIFDHYQKEFGDPESQNRLGLPPMSRLRYVALLDFINDQMYPPYLKESLLRRIQVERPQLFEQLRQLDEETLNQQSLQKNDGPNS